MSVVFTKQEVLDVIAECPEAIMANIMDESLRLACVNGPAMHNPESLIAFMLSSVETVANFAQFVYQQVVKDKRSTFTLDECLEITRTYDFRAMTHDSPRFGRYVDRCKDEEKRTRIIKRSEEVCTMFSSINQLWRDKFAKIAADKLV